MPLTNLSSDQTYKPVLEAANYVGKTFPRKKNKSVDVNKYQNLQNISKNSGISALDNLGTVTVPYGGNTKYESFHPGIDIGAAQGTNIPATMGGRVTEIRRGQEWTPNTPSFGNYVTVTDAYGGKHRYSHLYQSYVKVGQEVQPGQMVGSVGGTGSTYSQHHEGPGPHLDYRIRDMYGKYTNPTEYINKYR